MDYSFLLSVALIWGVAVVTPGPNFFITVQTALDRSYSSAAFVVFGISVGTIIWAVFGYLGISLLFKSAPWVYTGLKLIGSVYLIYLGIRLIWFQSEKQVGTNLVELNKVEPLKFFSLGLLTNLTNPKTAIFMASLLAATMPSNISFTAGLASTFIIFSLSFCWYTLVAVLFSLSRLRHIYSKSRFWIQRTAGIIFIGFGVKLVRCD